MSEQIGKGVTTVERRTVKGGPFSLSGHYEMQKLYDAVSQRIDGLEDRLAVAELKLFELEKNAKSRRSSRVDTKSTESYE